uniref:Ig-like domain-containing protein n=1 Tax=Macrostomum lignano TaxID=282301 RepID=A0A1I8HS30_9PLAT
MPIKLASRLNGLLTWALLLLALTVTFGAGSGSTEKIRASDASAADSTVTGDAGDFVILRCRMRGISRYDHLRWFGPSNPSIPLTIGDVTFTTDPRISVERESLGHEEFLNLVISFVSVRDAGVYRCSNQDSPATEQSVFLNVIC